MRAIPVNGRIRTLLQAVLLGIAYYLLASPAAQMEDRQTLAAIAWPAPALAIALLWRLPYRRWPIYLLAVLTAMLEVGRLDWLPWHTDVGFAILNVLEVALCAWLGQRYVAADAKLDSIAKLTRFILLLPLGAVALIAVLGASLAITAMPLEWRQEWRVLMVGNGLAVLVLVPALLAWSRLPGQERPWRPGAAKLGALAAIAAVTVVLLLSVYFDLSEEVLRMMLSLILVSTAIYGGMKSASLAVGVAAALGITLTLLDLGPYRHHEFNSTWRLQVDLAGLAILSFFVAIAIQERKQLAVHLEQARRFEALGLLAGGIAHDFNNILGAVRGYAEIAEESLSTGAPAQKPLREVISAAARGRDLTEQILLAARRGDRLRAVLDLRDVAREAVALATPLCRPGITISLQLPPDAVPVFAHRDQMTRAALNLVRNATQAARTTVAVSVAVTSRSGAAGSPLLIGDVPTSAAAWIEVGDDGPGIARENIGRLFEPFFSTRNGANGTGTGLGLAIVAGIAIEHDGGVGVSTGEAGTQFRFVLPLTQPQHELHHERPLDDARETALAVIGNGERVMLLDDDRALRERLEEWLAELGFEPISHDDPHQALAEAMATPADIALLVTDLDMPMMRGDALAIQIREHIPGLPVILCSGHPNLRQIAQATEAVALAKPFDLIALSRATMAALNGKS